MRNHPGPDFVMRIGVLLFFTLLICGSSFAARAQETALCQYQLRYDIAIEAGQVQLSHARNAPDVRIAGNRLWIGEREQPLSAIERRRLADYSRGLTQLLGDVSRVALDGVQMGIEQAALALAALDPRDRDGASTLHRFDALRGRMQNQFDGHHLSARVLGHDFDQAYKATIADIIRDALRDDHRDLAPAAAMRPAGSGSLDARADPIEYLIDAHLQQRGRQLERETDALCSQVRRLDVLENSLGRFDAFDRDAPSI